MTKFISLPVDLEANAINKFDTLVSQGEILYKEACWKRVEDGNITVLFRCLDDFHGLF